MPAPLCLQQLLLRLILNLSLAERLFEIFDHTKQLTDLTIKK